LATSVAGGYSIYSNYNNIAGIENYNNSQKK